MAIDTPTSEESTDGNSWPSPHDQSTVAPTPEYAGSVQAGWLSATDRWSWRWMLPAAPEGQPANLRNQPQNPPTILFVTLNAACHVTEKVV